MKTGPQYKVCRRLGSGVFDKCQTQQYVLSEARHTKAKGRGRRSNVSDFGLQLLEKQRVRFAYGVGERQLRKYVAEARRVGAQGHDSSAKLAELLERRLDNCVYRAGLAPTRRAARQLVGHGHILVNGTRTTVPSCSVSPKDVIEVRPQSKEKPVFSQHSEALQTVTTPNWLTFDSKQLTVEVKSLPAYDGTEMVGSVGAILEYYSR